MRLLEWKLNPDLIPHQDFHRGYWLNIDEPNPWYYFFPTKRDYIIPQNPKFYDTVDSELIMLIKLLHRSNIPTTPSCSGHFKLPKFYIDLYKKLKQNEKRINKEGIILNNKETNKSYFYKNPTYKLPWYLTDFVDKSLDYQTKGVVGFVDTKKDLYEVLVSSFDCLHDQSITLVFENSTEAKSKRANWKDLYMTIANYL